MNDVFKEMEALLEHNDKLFLGLKDVIDKLEEKKEKKQCCKCCNKSLRRPQKPALSIPILANKLLMISKNLEELSKQIVDNVDYANFPEDKANELSNKLEKQLNKIKSTHPNRCKNDKIFLKKVLVYCLLRCVSNSTFIKETFRKISTKFKSFKDFDDLNSVFFEKDLKETLDEINHELADTIGKQISVECKVFPYCIDVTAYLEDSPFLKIEFRGEDIFCGRTNVGIWVSRKGIYDQLETKSLNTIEKACKSLKELFLYLWLSANPTE